MSTRPTHTHLDQPAANRLACEAIDQSIADNRTVELCASGDSHEHLRTELLALCDEHDDNGLYWGEGWQVGLVKAPLVF